MYVSRSLALERSMTTRVVFLYRVLLGIARYTKQNLAIWSRFYTEQSISAILSRLYRVESFSRIFFRKDPMEQGLSQNTMFSATLFEFFCQPNVQTYKVASQLIQVAIVIQLLLVTGYNKETPNTNKKKGELAITQLCSCVAGYNQLAR